MDIHIRWVQGIVAQVLGSAERFSHWETIKKIYYFYIVQYHIYPQKLGESFIVHLVIVGYQC